MNMIDAKYGMKYPFPHTMTHIIDNSGYNGTVSVTYADDPSLFSTLVVGAFPMGEDQKVIKLEDTSIPRVCYGLNSITQADRDKYGQVVDYPLSLLAQGAPVQILRVTPEDATYAFTTILIKYKWDDNPENESIFHVKFETDTEAPIGSVLSNFRNPERLAQAIFNQYAKTDPTEDGWYTRAFAVIVSAGRGAIYNNMNMAINTVSQPRRPSNVRYSFSTIDTRTSSVIEEFVATLVNIDNNSEVYTETVNNVINKRTKGGSVLKPFINEKAVVEVFNKYKKAYEDMLDTGDYVDDVFITNTYKTLNVNTFDIITGKYIYGGGLDTHLPFYQVDAEDPDIPRLDEAHKLLNTRTQYDTNPDGVLESLMLDTAYGITRNGCSIYVGDLYLNGTGSRLTNPRLSLVCGINQYTKAVTVLSTDKIYKLVSVSGEPPVGVINVQGGYGIKTNDTPVPIKKIFETEPTIDYINAAGLEVGDVYAVINSSTTNADEFTIYTIITKTEATFTSESYTKTQLISAFPYTKEGIANILSLYDGTDFVANFDKHKSSIGYPVINIATGKVYVNNYDITDADTFPDKSILINDTATKFGATPTIAGTASDIVGTSYDVITYAESDVAKWTIATVNVNGPIGSGYALGDTFTTGNDIYVLLAEQPEDWTTNYSHYYEYNAGTHSYDALQAETPFVANTYYEKQTGVSSVQFKVTGVDPADGGITELTPVHNNASNSTVKLIGEQTLVYDANNTKKIKVVFTDNDNVPAVVKPNATPYEINRYVISGIMGSLYKITLDGVNVPDDYYSPNYGVNLSSAFGGVPLENGSAGFLDEAEISDIVFKYKYAELLTKAFRGQIDPRILSPTRVPAKYLFDAAFNTVVGSSFVTITNHSVADWINGSVNFTDDEKDEILFYPGIISQLEPADIDVKQAMYDLMIERVYDGIPEERRPIGPGSGFQVLFDSCLSDGATAEAINRSFASRFTNPNASWDIGGLTTPNGYTYTFVKRSVDNLFNHCKTYSVNKPFTGDYTTIAPTEYVSIFPDVDANNWEYRELMWNSGGNAWIPDDNGYIKRRSQRTFYGEETSDLIWESNMRTLSQLCYLLRQKIEHYLFEYSDDSTLKTMKTECDTMFSNWIGDLVESLEIEFERGLNTDGGDIVICNVRVTFRGLIIRVPIIVNVERRTS